MFRLNGLTELSRSDSRVIEMDTVPCTGCPSKNLDNTQDGDNNTSPNTYGSSDMYTHSENVLGSHVPNDVIPHKDLRSSPE